MMMSDQINELATALAKAQGKMSGALKDSKNPFFKSSYADLASCWDACRAQLAENGLAVIQTTIPTDGASVEVLTTLVHSSGQWMQGQLRMTPKEATPQGIGSCITYARRYALAAIVGIAQIDDDAEGAHGRQGTTTQARAELEGVELTPKKRDEYMPEILACLANEDSPGLRQLWDELTDREQGGMWQLLNSKQKASARALLQKAAA